MTEPKAKPPSTEQVESPILAVIDRAREEIAWVRSAYKFALSIIAILIAIGLYFSHKSIQDLKSELRSDGDRIQMQLKTESSLQARTMTKDLEEEVDRIRSQVTKRIEDEFQQENIASLVKEQAQARIDAIADNIIKTQIDSRITPLRTDLTSLISQTSTELDARVKNLDKKIDQSQATEKELRELLTQARQTVDEVKTQSDFVLTVLAAQSDDRHAFEKIRAWARSPIFSLRQQAAVVERDIVKSYSGFLGNTAYLNLSWRDGFEPKDMTADQIRANWLSIPPFFARAYVEFVWKHENLTKDEKLEFLHDALSDSRGSMQAADWAAETLAKEGKVKYNPPFEFSGIEKWWSERGKTNSAPEKSTNKAIDSDKK